MTFIPHSKRLLRNIAGFSILSAGLVLCVGCGGQDEDATESGATNRPAAGAPSTTATAAGSADVSSTATITTGPGQQQADNQVDFFTERYLQSEERLKRRQDRLNTVLSQ